MKNGQLEYSAMPDLAFEANNRNDKNLASEAATKYKENYLDKLKDEAAFTKTNLFLVALFSKELLSSNDRYFHLFYKFPDLADSIVDYVILGKRQKVANSVILSVISKEEIENKIYKNGKPITEYKSECACCTYLH